MAPLSQLERIQAIGLRTSILSQVCQAQPLTREGMRESLTGAITDAGAGAGAIMGAKTGSGAIAAKACYAVSLTVGNQEFMYIFWKADPGHLQRDCT